MCSVISLSGAITGSFALNSANTDSIQRQFKISFDSNGGEHCDLVYFINGDDIKLPNPKKTGFTFGGWFYDSLFQTPFNSEQTLTQDIVLYAKWIDKPIKIFLDTAKENEFSPLIFNIGDKFNMSYLPDSSLVSDKIINGVSFKFSNWEGNYADVMSNDFTIEDKYYEYHAVYRTPNLDLYSNAYLNDFSTDVGYIDPLHSWTRGEFKLPGNLITVESSTPSIEIWNNKLYLDQKTCLEKGYGSKVLLPYEFTTGLKEYVVETKFTINDMPTLSSTDLDRISSLGCDVGFSVMTGYRLSSGANVAAVVDPYRKSCRIGAIDNDGGKSNIDSVTSMFEFMFGDDFDWSAEHTLKIKHSSLIPSTQSALNNSYLIAYVDGIECFNTKTNLLNKPWYFANNVNGDYIGLSSNLCSTFVSDVKILSLDESSVIYEYDFKTNNPSKFSYLHDCRGSNVGQVDVSNGTLNINSYFRNIDHVKHQIIKMDGTENIKNGYVSFDFKFNNVSSVSKYLGLVIRGDEETNYSMLCLRAGNGNISLMKHTNFNNRRFSSWENEVFLKSYNGALNDGNTHSVSFTFVDNYISLYIDGVSYFNDMPNDKCLFNKKGYIGFLASSASVSIDNLIIYDLGNKLL